MGLSDRLSHIKINSEQNKIIADDLQKQDKKSTTTTTISLPKEDHTAEDCGTCTLLGVSETKNQMFQFMNNPGAGSSSASTSKGNQSSVTNSNSSKSSKQEDQAFWEPMDEPVDTIELGNSGWKLLHTIAAYYPDKPTTQKQQHTKSFLESFSHVYPCQVCAKDFQEILVATPPRLNNQHEFAQWMCEAHNHVNNLLGKPSFDCDLVDKRWKRNKPPNQAGGGDGGH
ncbi:hypothetical protein SAMD00019534_074980 [Acytostelium subglobosum LB1]|uniref:hypothetical protein n=1 Tax=Acytostelium subglobosum LB1 TaxID=1410327 RepID=UPI00064520E6|nr:hypothetical protein SAMD00019534_074980 [Acytostelium subglobosum LB1]GAM24323.1 hypothetical protein SAMD00019534_074980 [Acytostelium subglobosum LB1]|eukprot:XP_012752649.1 hypothetical protein SAMD00019534_074980 [Acytostelium subglobosum LB1]